MIYKSGHVEASVRQVDSEFRVILGSFCFGKIYEILYGGQEFSLSDISCSIFLAEDLEWAIAVFRQIISAITFPIPSSYRQRCRKIVCKTDAIYGIVSSSAAIGCRNLLADAAILIDERLFGCFGSVFCFGFFRVDL